MKSIIFQSKASFFVQSQQPYLLIFNWRNQICFPNRSVKKKPKWISDIRRTNHKELINQSSFCVNYFLRYYLMMQHQPIVKRVNGAHEWAHRPYQLLSATYHCCLYPHRRQEEGNHPEQLTGAYLYLDIFKSGYLCNGYSGGVYRSERTLPNDILAQGRGDYKLQPAVNFSSLLSFISHWDTHVITLRELTGCTWKSRRVTCSLPWTMLQRAKVLMATHPLALFYTYTFTFYM